MLNAIQVVQKVQDKQWIPEAVHKQTYFGEYDLWLYVPIYDEKLCEKCHKYSLNQVFRGSELREAFQELEFVDEDKFLANVHPNCRCELYRVIKLERYLRLLEKIEERERNE